MSAAAAELVPVEQHQGIWFKREDKFAPWGVGGANGSKLRQLIWQLEHTDAKIIVAGSSPVSPLTAMGAVLCALQGRQYVQYLGQRTPEAARAQGHGAVQIAEKLGAELHLGVAPAYAANLLSAASKHAREHPGAWAVPYAISPEPGTEVEFHELGAQQVQNLPRVKRLLLPTGSANTAASALYGLKKYGSPVAEVHLLLTAKEKNALKHIRERLALLGVAKGDIPPVYVHDVIGKRRWAYETRIEESWGDIVFHPNYEGKLWRYLKEDEPQLLESACFWVVGGEPHWEPMSELLQQYEKVVSWVGV